MPLPPAASEVSLSPALTYDMGSKMWVFRDGKRRMRTADLVSALNAELPSGNALHVLLRAGELEPALDDAGEPSTEVARITDAAALALVHEEPLRWDTPLALPHAPEYLRVGTPEGFAFYLLHPLSFRDLARQVHPHGAPAAVVGVRSIGAPLSAVVGATLSAPRTTVRPTGHPYHRTVEFTPSQQEWVRQQGGRGATFYVVDEGPGFSGSSLISTCEALEREGVPISNIVILCTARPNPEALSTHEGARRWNRFRSHKTMPWLPPEVRDEKWYWAEHWRKRIWGDDEGFWPGVWRQVETPKFLASDDHRLFRFIGFGHYGKSVFERYNGLARAGFGPDVKGGIDGFAEFWMEGGSAFSVPRWNEKTHHFIVRYLSERARLCGADAEHAAQNVPDIERMVRFNTAEIVGEAYEPHLRVERPVYADNRMYPYKFMRTPSGMKKLDGGPHGEDHFFPGPCDIAWDIAGAIHEWGLSPSAAEKLLQDYVSASGDLFVRSRLRDWTVAYLSFRAGYCLMGANANQGWPEGERLMRDARSYAVPLCTLTQGTCQVKAVA